MTSPNNATPSIKAHAIIIEVRTSPAACGFRALAFHGRAGNSTNAVGRTDRYRTRSKTRREMSEIDHVSHANFLLSLFKDNTAPDHRSHCGDLSPPKASGCRTPNA